MKSSLRITFLTLLTLVTVSGYTLETAHAAGKCPKGKVKNFILTGKCITKKAKLAGVKQLKKDGCNVCHSGNGAACPFDLGEGSCTYKKMAQILKAQNESEGNPKSIPPGTFINLFDTYAPAYMDGIHTPTTAAAKKYINYLSTIKQ